MTIDETNVDRNAPGGAAERAVPRHSVARLALRTLEFAGWFALAAAVTLIPLGLLFRAMAKSDDDAVATALTMGIDDPELIAVELFQLVAALFATWRLMRRDRLSWAQAGLPGRGIVRGLIVGLSTGVANFTLVPCIARMFGWATVERAVSDASIVTSFAQSFSLLLFGGAFEEVLLRGVLLTLIAVRSPIVAVAVTSVVFTILHLTNPGAGLVAALGVFVPGVVLAIARFRTGALWVPIGWHLGWNLGQGWLFGCPVSGMLPAKAPYLVARFDGPEIAVGGAFGPESGLIAVASYLLTLLAFLSLVRRPPAPSPPP